MIDEKYLQMAINIRRTYLKLINNLDLYKAKAAQVSNKLEETMSKLDTIQNDLSKKDKTSKTNDNEILSRLLKIIDEIEEEGKRLENLVDPINSEIEKLSKEEIELYRLIVEHHPNLTEDQIVSIVGDRLIKEGLS